MKLDIEGCDGQLLLLLLLWTQEVTETVLVWGIVKV